jgi:hypothetical protein
MSAVGTHNCAHTHNYSIPYHSNYGHVFQLKQTESNKTPQYMPQIKTIKERKLV